MHTDPPSGTQIEAEEYSSVDILCDIDGVQQQHWVLATPHELMLISDDDDRFLITGNHMSRLIIRNVTEELDGAVIFCQIAFHGNIRIANFSIHIEGKLRTTADSRMLTYPCTCQHILLYIHKLGLLHIWKKISLNYDDSRRASSYSFYNSLHFR